MKRMMKNSVTNSKSTDSQNEYEYRKNIYLKRKHEFETLGEEDNNDVLSREEKMNIAKAEIDKVANDDVYSADAVNTNLSPEEGDRVRMDNYMKLNDGQEGIVTGRIGELCWVTWDDGTKSKEIKGYLTVIERDGKVVNSSVKVAPKSVKSSKDATFKNDKRLSTTSERYRGYLIVLDRGGDGYNVYDKHRELEDAGYPSKEAAKRFIDELVDNGNDYINSAYEYGVSDWRELASKSVEDSDGFNTDYTLYTNGETYICMFGDKDMYEPDAAYADYETESEQDAWDWFNSYSGFADEEGYDDLMFIDNRKSSIVNNDPSLDPGFDEYDVYGSGVKASIGKYYFGKDEADKYGNLIADNLKGQTISKREDLAEAPGGLIYEANKLGIDMWELLRALEGMCADGRAREIDDSTYKILGASESINSSQYPYRQNDLNDKLSTLYDRACATFGEDLVNKIIVECGGPTPEENPDYWWTDSLDTEKFYHRLTELFLNKMLNYEDFEDASDIDAFAYNCVAEEYDLPTVDDLDSPGYAYDPQKVWKEFRNKITNISSSTGVYYPNGKEVTRIRNVLM